MALSHDDVREILRIIDESDLDELRIDTDGFSLHVRKGATPSHENETDSDSRSRAPAAPAPPASPATPASSAAAGGARVSAGENETDSQSEDGLVEIPSPMLGTFYRAESPGAAPFVEVGARVEPDTIVCIIEVMKMMNSIPAGIAGTLAEVCGNNGRLVEYGEPLFRVQPR